MSSVALLALFIAADPVPQPRRLLDDATLLVTAERCVELGNKLLAAMPESRSKSLRPRVETFTNDARGDVIRLRRSIATTTDEATVLFTYGELCKLAGDTVGYDKIKFQPNPHRPAYVEDLTKIGITKINNDSFAQTLQQVEGIVAASKTTKDLLATLRAKKRRDDLQTAKWHRDLDKLERERAKAEDDLKQSINLSKAPAEAILYGIYGRAVGMMAEVER